MRRWAGASLVVGLTGAGAGLPLPAAPLGYPLVVQVQAIDAGCWSGDFAAP